MHGKLLQLQAVEVIALSDGIFDYRSPNTKGLTCNLGPSARLRHGNGEFIVVSMRIQAIDDGMIYATSMERKEGEIKKLNSIGTNIFRKYGSVFRKIHICIVR